MTFDPLHHLIHITSKTSSQIINGDGHHHHLSSVTINVASDSQYPISNGHTNGQLDFDLSPSSSIDYQPSPTSSSTITIPLHTGSQEQIVASTSTSTTNRTPHFQICISSVPNTGVNTIKKSVLFPCLFILWIIVIIKKNTEMSHCGGLYKKHVQQEWSSSLYII